ncbi:SDR family NAD(P)-dependent oxidoreductase [Kribbella ginsengisoli]|uniref:SDR family NAD(P)-dependent oxidoreductase n=1 Tax=Kribbella ginsengisoli TaxID=363865 RepID=A0ABP6YNE3_9ACTN
MNVTDQIALVTGANRGIGRQFVLELLERGASKVYATARRPETLDFDDPRVVPLRLDLLDHESVVAAAAAAGDVSLLVNNAGIRPAPAWSPASSPRSGVSWTHTSGARST